MTAGHSMLFPDVSRRLGHALAPLFLLVAGAAEIRAQCPPPVTPSITSVTPSAGYPVAGNDVAITVNGSNFVNGESVVDLNGFTETHSFPLASVFVSGTQMTATVPASLLAHAVNDEQTWSLDILVENDVNQNGSKCNFENSNQIPFSINDILMPAISLTVPSGGSASRQLVFYNYAGTTIPLSLSCSGLPAGASCAFTPNSASACGSGASCSPVTLTVSTTSATPAGTSSFTVSATSGPLTRTRSASLVVAAQSGASLSVNWPPPDGPNGTLAFELATGATSPDTFSVAVSNTGSAGSNLNWTVSSSTQPTGGTWLTVSPTSGTNAGSFTVSINATGLAAGAYSGTVTVTAPNAANSPQTLPLTLTVGSHTPAILSGGIVPLYSTSNTIQPGEWISIFGSNFASGNFTWTGNFPTSLGDVSVTIDNKPAYLWYVSPGQINVQAPDDGATGSVPVVVNGPNGTVSSTVTLGSVAPSFNLLDGKHVAAIILRPDGSGAYGGGTYDIVGPPGSSLGYATVAAKAGDTVELFGVGFGATTPPVDAGQTFSGAAATKNPVSVLINHVSVIPAFSGLSGAGLYQINLVIPSGLGVGDVPLVASVGGAETPSNVVISLQ